MTKKQIFRTVAFALVVCLMLVLMCDIFELTDNSYIPSRFQTFYSLEEDTLDAVWVGTSAVDRYWIAAKAYEEYGMTVYPLSSNQMATWLFTDVIDEALQTQSPELIIVDMRAFSQDNNDTEATDARARRVLDAMAPFSPNRLSVALKTMDVLKQIDSERSSFDLSYVLSFIKYHSIWSEDDFSLSDSVSHKECPYLGFYMRKQSSIVIAEQAAPSYPADSYEALDPITEEALYELLDYVKEKDLNVLFVNSPGRMRVIENARVNTVCQILDEQGVAYINYASVDENGTFVHIPELDSACDFYDRSHVNYYGAEKFTQVFSAYLNENYGFTDHRTDSAVTADWDGVYEKIKNQISRWEASQTPADAEADSTPDK